MYLQTIWVSETGGFGGAWMAAAWDEFRIEENPDGWREDVKKAREAHREVRIIRVEVPVKPFKEAFEPPAVESDRVQREIEA